MKKLISFVMATVLCLGMTTSVMAAYSVTTEDLGNVEGTVTSISSTTAGVGKIDIAPVVVDAKNDPGLVGIGSKSHALDQVRTVGSALNISSAKTLAYFDLSVADTTDKVMAATVRFTVPAIDSDKIVWVLHYVTSTDKWEYRPTTVIDAEAGIIEASFDANYSPVMIVEFTLADGGALETAEAVSPKTADVMVGLYAVAALTGTVVAARKVRKNK